MSKKQKPKPLADIVTDADRFFIGNYSDFNHKELADRENRIVRKAFTDGWAAGTYSAKGNDTRADAIAKKYGGQP